MSEVTLFRSMVLPAGGSGESSLSSLLATPIALVAQQPFDVRAANTRQGETVNTTADLRRPSEPPVFIAVLTRTTHSVEHSVEKYIADKFAAINSTLAVYRERIGETLRFYTVVRDDDEGENLDRLFDEEKGLYKCFPQDELDFQFLLGEELRCAVPSAATLVWQRD